MKNMLIAASALGAVIAGMMLYAKRKNGGSSRMEGAAKDAYATINKGIGAIERPAHHAMG